MVLASLVTFISLGAAVVALVARRMWVIAEPDEWLLFVRNGRVVRAGVGIALFRRPGDTVARFSSSVQRVRFAVHARTKEHLAVSVDGFILWSVASDAEAAFRAVSKLGIVNLNHPHTGLRSRSHLLTSPQHHAFQALLAAEVRAHLSSLSLHDLLTEPRALLKGLAERFDALSESLGIRIERTELLELEPTDEGLLRDLSARSEEAVREEAESVRMATADRLRTERAASAAREALELTHARLAKVDADRHVELREGEAVVARGLAEEAGALSILHAHREREELLLSAELDRMRRTADADRDAALARSVVEEQKSQAVRDLEIAKLVTERTTAALGAWPIRDAKWVSVGDGSPLGSIAGVLEGVRALVTPRSETARE